MKLLKKKRLNSCLFIFIVVLFISFLKYNNRTKLTPTNVSKLQSHLTYILNDDYQITKKDTFIFLYNQDYTQSELLYSNNNILNVPDNKFGDGYLHIVLEYHKNKTCNILDVSKLSNSSKLRRYSLLLNSSNVEVRFLSCPIYIKEDLYGYVGSYINTNDGIYNVSDLLYIQYLSRKIGNELSIIF